jgi:hypothetical protein
MTLYREKGVSRVPSSQYIEDEDSTQAACRYMGSLRSGFAEHLSDLWATT